MFTLSIGGSALLTFADKGNEYLSYIPQSCIYYCAGRRARSGRLDGRTALLSAAHAHAAAPALLAAAAAWHSADAHQTLLTGALLSSLGAPCAWLSLVAARDAGAALALLTVNYVTSLVATPITMFLVCGRAPIPALGPTLWAGLCAIPPLAAGAAHTHLRSSALSQRAQRSQRRAERVAMLALVYVDCCERTAAAAGLHVADVLATLLLAFWCVSGSALVCVLYARLGLSAAHAHLVAVCAVPKAMHTGWQTSLDCVPSGLSQLPSACLAPAQALLLAALDTPPDGPDSWKDFDDTPAERDEDKPLCSEGF